MEVVYVLLSTSELTFPSALMPRLKADVKLRNHPTCSIGISL